MRNLAGKFLLLTSALSCLMMSQPAVCKSTADREFAALNKKYYDAWNKADYKTLDTLYAQDARRVFFDIAPMEYKNWSEYRAGSKKNFFDQMQSGEITPGNDFSVMRQGNMAWSTDTFHISAVMKNGQRLELDCRHTLIWEKRGGKWQIVHEHCSVPLPMETPKA